MPDQPLWLAKLPEVLATLRSSDQQDWTTAQLSRLLAIGQRRAQQVLQPLMKRVVGHIALIDRRDAIAFFEAISRGEAFAQDTHRRQRLAQIVSRLQPRVLVEAPLQIVETRLETLPGVVLSPGRITIEGFRTGEEALQKLLALAMAIDNGQAEFAEQVRKED